MQNINIEVPNTKRNPTKKEAGSSHPRFTDRGGGDKARHDCLYARYTFKKKKRPLSYNLPHI